VSVLPGSPAVSTACLQELKASQKENPEKPVVKIEPVVKREPLREVPAAVKKEPLGDVLQLQTPVVKIEPKIKRSQQSLVDKVPVSPDCDFTADLE